MLFIDKDTLRDKVSFAGDKTQCIVCPLGRSLLNTTLGLIIGRTDFPEKLKKKQKENSDATNFFNLNKHRLKEQPTRMIFSIPQPTAKALATGKPLNFALYAARQKH